MRQTRRRSAESSPATTSTIRNKPGLPKWAAGLLVFFAWMMVWEIVYLAVGADILIASPRQVAARLWALLGTGGFYKTVGLSIARIMSGFLLGLCAAAVLAVLTCRFGAARAFFRPLLSVIKATPVASFIILALVWMSDSNVTIFSTFLMVTPLAWANLCAGIQGVDQKLLDMARVFGFSTGKKLKHIYLPSIMPYFISAVTTGIGFAWKSGVAAEVLATPKFAIGAQLYNAKIYLETADLFCWTAVIILISVLIEKAAVTALTRFAPRGEKEGGHGD